MKKNQQEKFLILFFTIGIFYLLINQIFFSKSKTTDEVSLKKNNEKNLTTDKSLTNSTPESLTLKTNFFGDNLTIPSNPNESNSNLKKFQDIARLDIQLPKGLNYVSLDLEDGMASLYAYNSTAKVGLTLFAAPRTASAAEAIAFARDISKIIPNFKDNSIEKLEETPTIIPTSEKTGLKDAIWWQGKTKTGDEVNIVLLPRKDNKGTYLIIGGGPATYFEEQEENFEKSLSTIKALPR